MTVRVCSRLNIDAVRSVGNDSWRLKVGYRRMAIKMGPAHFLPHRATVKPPTCAASLPPLAGVGLWPTAVARSAVKLTFACTNSYWDFERTTLYPNTTTSPLSASLSMPVWVWRLLR